MTIGGSTTDQRFITDGDTWQDVLAKEFASQGKTVSVVNAGIDGQSTVGHIRDFDWWFSSIPNLHARYFLFYVGINDFHMEDYNHYDDLLNSNSVMATIRDNSALYYVFRTLRGVYQAQVVAQVSHRAIDFDHIQWTDHGLVSDHQAVMNPRLAGFRERLRILGDKVRAFGGVPICVTQTERKFKRLGDRLVGDAEVIRYDQTSINGVDQYQLMKILNQVTLEECNAIGGIGIDLAGELEFNDSDFYDFIHNTPPAPPRSASIFTKSRTGCSLLRLPEMRVRRTAKGLTVYVDSSQDHVIGKEVKGRVTSTVKQDKVANRASSVLLSLVSILLVVGLLVGLAEVAVRVLNSGGMDYTLEMWKYARELKRVAADPKLGHEHIPGRTAHLMGVDVSINSHGLRDREIPYETPANTKRIIMLGGFGDFRLGRPI